MVKLARRHLLKGIGSLAAVGITHKVTPASALTDSTSYFSFRHQFSGKYMCSGRTENGGDLWLWGPIPDGHEVRYNFELIELGQGYFYLRHQFSGKYVCSGETENGGKLWLWGPIPDGHEIRYQFKVRPA